MLRGVPERSTTIVTSMASAPQVTPNRRGARSRQAVLDAAERLMAIHGYEGASLSAIIAESGIPISSVYHYYGSKDKILLAVMERGADRFFHSLPPIDGGVEAPEARLEQVFSTIGAALTAHPDFLRLLITLAVQPQSAVDAAEVHNVVNNIREEALRRLRAVIAIAFGRRRDARAVDRLARFTLAMIDGAFVAAQSDPSASILELLDQLPAALVALNDR